MILGIGTDLVEVSRIAAAMSGSGFKNRYFSAGEIAYCEPKRGKARNYAARFAAKEAFFKALGAGRGADPGDVEIVNGPQGKPELVLRGKAAESCRKRRVSGVFVSLTHIKDYAGAVVVIERRNGTGRKE